MKISVVKKVIGLNKMSKKINVTLQLPYNDNIAKQYSNDEFCFQLELSNSESLHKQLLSVDELKILEQRIQEAFRHYKQFKDTYNVIDD